jgi:hypothetical protein
MDLWILHWRPVANCKWEFPPVAWVPANQHESNLVWKMTWVSRTLSSWAMSWATPLQYLASQARELNWNGCKTPTQ